MRVAVVCVDCSDDRVRTQISRAVLKYGDRVQYSVYIVKGSDVVFAELNRDMKKWAKVAHVVVFDLGLVGGSTVKVTEHGEPFGGNKRASAAVTLPDVW